MRATAVARRPSRSSTRPSCAASAPSASLGASMVVTGPRSQDEVAEIVGVVRDTRSNGGDTRARPELYIPFAQTPLPSMNLIVRSANPSDPRLATDIRRAVAAIDPTLRDASRRWRSCSTRASRHGASARGCSACSRRWRCCSPPSGSPRRWPGGSRSAPARSACAWRSARMRVTCRGWWFVRPPASRRRASFSDSPAPPLRRG